MGGGEAQCAIVSDRHLELLCSVQGEPFRLTPPSQATPLDRRRELATSVGPCGDVGESAQESAAEPTSAVDDDGRTSCPGGGGGGGGGQRPLVHIHFGGAGCAAGRMLWDLFALEHRINECGADEGDHNAAAHQSLTFLTDVARAEDDFTAAQKWMEHREILFAEVAPNPLKPSTARFRPRAYFVNEFISRGDFANDGCYLDLEEPGVHLFDCRSCPPWPPRGRSPLLPSHAGGYFASHATASALGGVKTKILHALRHEAESADRGIDMVVNYSLGSAFGCGAALAVCELLADELAGSLPSTAIHSVFAPPVQQSDAGKTHGWLLRQHGTGALHHLNALCGLGRLVELPRRVASVVLLHDVPTLLQHHVARQGAHVAAPLITDALEDPFFAMFHSHSRQEQMRLFSVANANWSVAHSLLSRAARFGSAHSVHGVDALVQNVVPRHDSIFTFPSLSLDKRSCHGEQGVLRDALFAHAKLPRRTGEHTHSIIYAPKTFPSVYVVSPSHHSLSTFATLPPYARPEHPPGVHVTQSSATTMTYTSHVIGAVDRLFTKRAAFRQYPARDLGGDGALSEEISHFSEILRTATAA